MARGQFVLDGVMAYEGQIAGVGDKPPGRPLMRLALPVVQALSARELARRRAGVVDAVRSLAPLRFVNGERDEYTSVEDACLLAQHIDSAQFAVIDDAGHFLDMEHKAAWLQTQSVLLDFFNAPNKRLQLSVKGDLRELQAMAV